MKRIIVLLALSLGLSLWFIKFDLHIRAWASAGSATSKQLPLKQGGSSDQVSVRAAGRGKPLINLRDGSDLETAYVGSGEIQRALEPGRFMPLALTVGDFDEDGVPDVIGGYAHFEADSSVLALYRGNADSIYPNSPEAQNHKIRGEFTDSPFLPLAVVIALPEPPDYLGAGDFDADGHLDIVVAAARGQSLYVLSGDGRGGFHPARAVNLPGRLTALATGEINRADGLTDIVVGIEGGDGPKLMVFEGPQGALNSTPEVFQLRAEATTLALGQLDDDYALDLAVGAGSELLILHGRDRKLSLDTARRSEVQPAIISRQLLAFCVQSLAVGDFAANDRTGIAALSGDGEVHLLERTQDDSPARKPEDSDRKGVPGTGGDTETRSSSNSTWQERSALSLPGSPGLPVFAARSLLVSARVSSLPTDDLVVIDRSNDQLHILTIDAAAEMRSPDGQEISSRSAFVKSLRLSASLDVEGEPVAVVPMRLNTDALSDLVILRAGARSLTVTTSAALSTITVNDTADTNVRDSVLTLREAIMLAEGTLLKSSLTLAEQAQVTGTPAAGQEDEIRFNVPGAGAHTINPIPTGLPTITAAGGALTIDGTTQPGFAGMPLIELNGTGVTSNGGLMIEAGNSTVRGLVINRFINGIQVNASANNVFEGNFIGTDVTGSAGMGNSSSGIFIIGASNNTRIGGTTAAARNIISGNNGGGVAMFSSTGIMIQGNFIGTNVTGTAIIGNSGSGIRVSSNNNNTTIGGTAAGSLNLISGNIGTGLQIDGSNSGNIVQGNLIGTDITGTLDFGNQTGIAIGSANNTIGGTTTAARNLISGNNGDGILLNGGGANTNLTQGNFIGTDASGTADLGNNLWGVDINFGSGNTIGGTATGAGNLISGNNFQGLNLGGPGNVVQGNLIGTQQNGTSPLGNSMGGLIIGFSNNTIGGIDPGAGNIIAFNGDDGVEVAGGTGNAIRDNSIFSNGTTIQHLGIDLGNSGVTPNDDCDLDAGPNNLQNFPVITSASSSGGSTTIVGTLNSTAGTTFTIDFFANQSCDASGNGEGQTFLGSTTVTTAASPNCSASFNFTTGAAPTGQNVVTATATDPSGNTSEFSQCITVLAECTITCPQNQTVNTGPGPTQCGATVNYPAPTTVGSCGTVTCTPSSGSFLAIGTTTVNCTTTSGPNCSFTVTVADDTPPTIACPANITQNTDPNQCSAMVAYTTPTPSDNCPGVTAMCTPAAGSTFQKGVTTVTCTATDSSNNTAVCSFTVTVNDTQAPTIAACPANITKSTDPNVCTAVVVFTPPTATDNCTPAPTVACSPASGSTFNKGTTTVTCTATDSSNNTAMCSFTVMVNDAQAPTITCPSNTATSTSGSCAVVNYPAPTIADNCSGTTANCSPPSGTCFPPGTTTVNCTATDASGNQAACSFTVTVNQTTCAISCPPSITTSNDPNQCGAVVAYNAPTTTGTCGTVICSPGSGSFFPVGTTTVTCRSNSNAGPESCTFTVRVSDTQPPTITCPVNINAAGATSCPFATTSGPVNFSVPASDNCPGVTVACKNQSNVVVTSGSTFPGGTTTVTCTATDPSGNSASCSFPVTVFSGCLQDDTDPSLVVLFNVQTGQYQFCCGGTLYNGAGTVSAKGCVVTIQHNASDRRVLIRVEGSANAGTASVQFPSGTLKCSIRDRDTRNNSCVCP